MSAIASHSSAGSSGRSPGSPLGEKRLVVDARRAARRRGSVRVDDVDHQRPALAAARAPRAMTGANSVSVSSTLALAVLEDEGDRLGVEPDVERVQHGAGHRHAEMRLERRRDVRRHHRHRVAAAAMPRAGQRRGEPAAARAERRRSSSLAPVDHRDPLRIDVGRALQEAERRQRHVVGRVAVEPLLVGTGSMDARRIATGFASAHCPCARPARRSPKLSTRRRGCQPGPIAPSSALFAAFNTFP